MRAKYTLKQQRFDHPAGTVVYAYTGHDYGLVREDQQATGILHMAVTLDPNGGTPFFTVPLRDLAYEIVEDSPLAQGLVESPVDLPATEPPAPTQPPRRLTFDEFRAANRQRCLKWHPHGIESWSDSDWLVAIMGELGELASLIKMRNRERDNLPGNKFSPTDKQVADEAADVFTYLDLFCERNGIRLGDASVAKFNEVSERVGFPDRIDLGAPVQSIVAEVCKSAAHQMAFYGPVENEEWHATIAALRHIAETS